jgi:hypothetical protein
MDDRLATLARLFGLYAGEPLDSRRREPGKVEGIEIVAFLERRTPAITAL